MTMKRLTNDEARRIAGRIAAPHGPTIQTRADISGGETATVITTANNEMVSVIAV
jgi:hypothetical protein